MPLLHPGFMPISVAMAYLPCHDSVVLLFFSEAPSYAPACNLIPYPTNFLPTTFSIQSIWVSFPWYHASIYSLTYVSSPHSFLLSKGSPPKVRCCKGIYLALTPLNLIGIHPSTPAKPTLFLPYCRGIGLGEETDQVCLAYTTCIICKYNWVPIRLN